VFNRQWTREKAEAQTTKAPIKLFNYYTPLSMIQYFEPNGLSPEQIEAAKAAKLCLASIKEGTDQHSKQHQQTKLNFQPISWSGQGKTPNAGRRNNGGRSGNFGRRGGRFPVIVGTNDTNETGKPMVTNDNRRD
jgi:hypothetical protein